MCLACVYMGSPEIISYGRVQLPLDLVQATPALLLDDSQPLPGFSASHLILSVLYPASRSLGGGGSFLKHRADAVTVLHE